MPILAHAVELLPEVSGWRKWLHERPEIGFEVPETANFVAEKLQAFGCDEIVRGIGGSGVVGLIRGRYGAGPTVALRADMDALPIIEEGTAPHASRREGKMHACGHDGHTSMLLGAARCLAQTRDFAGTAVLIFQPAEEIGQGAKAMLADGLMDRFEISRVYGMHNMPGIPTGQFAIRTGGIMAAVAKFTIRITGRGGHAARPHQTIDPLIAATQVIDALQTIVSRGADPIAALVVTVTRVDAGSAYNIIPETVELWGTTRALDMDNADMAQRRVREICAGIALASGTQIDVDYDQAHPVTFNTQSEAAFAASVAREVAGAVDEDVRPVMAGEDFCHMLNARPGALIFIGNGNSTGLHHPAYDFDDDAIPAGISYWVRLVETALKPA